MARLEVLPTVEKEYQLQVDELLRHELDGMRALAGIKKKKAKKSKKKKQKKAKKKGWKLPGYRLIRDKDEYDLLVDLIQHNIVKKVPPQLLSEFIGEFNYIHSMVDDLQCTPHDPSMALIR